eukprot:gene15819-19327_t
MTYQEAIAIRYRYYGPEVPIREIHETDAYWWFPHSLIGSQGIVIDKADGHIQCFGSGLSLDEWFYAYRHGFRHAKYIHRITAVHNADAVLQIFGSSLKSVIDHPPFDLSFCWLQYPSISFIKRTRHFDSQFIVAACESEGCTVIGKVLPPLSEAVPPPHNFL